MNKIEYALKLAKDCIYADEMMEGAKEHLRKELDEAIQQVKNNAVLPHVSGSLPVYDIDFGGHCKAGIKIENGKPVVIGAMNGWGDGIDSGKIKIVERQ